MDTEADVDEAWQHATTITLSNKERDFFLALLEADETPSEKALAAAALYNEESRKSGDYHRPSGEE